MMEIEAQLFNQLPRDAKVNRLFLRGGAQPPASGASFIGWLSLVYFIVGEEGSSSFQSRILNSQAVNECCLLNIAVDSPTDRVRSKSGHDLCPNQRSMSFHAALLQGLGIMTSSMTSGSLPIDFFWLSTRPAPPPLPSSL